METKNQLLESKNIKSNKDFQQNLLITIKKYNEEIQEKRKKKWILYLELKKPMKKN